MNANRKRRSGVVAALLAMGLVATAGTAMAAPDPGSIGPGSTDREAVACVQQALAVDTGGAPYGEYGDLTTAAVRRFQASHGLPAIGSVGPATAKALTPLAPGSCGERLSRATSTSSATDAAPGGENRSYPGCPLLHEGQTDDCVQRLQNDLNSVNSAYHLPGTRFFGAATRIALLDFQGRNHLGADGVFGPQAADLLASKAAGAGAPPTPGPSGEKVVDSPDVKVVRYLKVGLEDCMRSLISHGVATPQAAAAGCGFLSYASNPTPPDDLSGDNWSSFVASEEFRGFSHVPPMRLTCRDGVAQSVERQSQDGVFGVSPGWTPAWKAGHRVYEKAERFDEDKRFDPDREEVRRLADGSGYEVSARQASRIANLARAGQNATLFHDAPFIWSASHTVLRCDGTVEVTYGGSTIPGTRLYVGDRSRDQIPQSTDYADFIKAGGRIPHPPGHGALYDRCDSRRVTVSGSSGVDATLPCSSLIDDGGERLAP